jgi:cell division protein FtsI/penicillin-binding protein 2
VWLITKDNPEYIVVVQVRRPRTNFWGAQTAGRIFSEVAEFLIGYSLVERIHE